MQRRGFLLAGAATLASPHISRAQAASTLRFIPQADLSTLDPHWNTAYVTRNHGFMVFDTLFGMGSNYQPSPQMVEGQLTEDDGRRVTLKLREGLRWHDGTPVLARDCVASIRRWGTKDTFGQALMAATDELSAPDDKHVLFRLKRRFPLLSTALGKYGVYMPAMMPERLARTDPGTQVAEMVGSGPFRFLANERVPGARAVYERNKEYVPLASGEPSGTAGPKVVHLDRVEWQTTPDPSTAAAALQAGEVDWWDFVTPDLKPLLARQNSLRVTIQDPAGFIGVFRMNHLHPPFDNPAIRRALLGGIVQSDYMIAAAGEDPTMWRDGVGMFTPGSPMASDAGMEALLGPRDLERVKRDLLAAGYKGEPVALLVATDFPHLKAMSDVGADMMRRAGMNVDYQALDWGTVLSKRGRREPPEKGGWSASFTFSAGADNATPAANTPLRANGMKGWFGWPDDSKIEQLRDAWFAAPDLAAQKAIAADLQRQAFQSVPFIPLGQYFQATAYRRTVTGVLPGFATFWNVRKEG